MGGSLATTLIISPCATRMRVQGLPGNRFSLRGDGK